MKTSAQPFFLSGNDETALLFLHGFTGSPSEVYPAAYRVHELSGCTVSGILLPGHGTNPGDLNQTGWQDWVAAVEKEAQRLAGIYPQVYLAGLSMGGLLAIYSGLQLYNTSGIISINAPVMLRRPWLERLAPVIERVIPYYPKDMDECSQLEKLGRFAYNCLPVRAFRSMVDLREQVIEDIQNLQSPLLLIQAMRDESVKPDSAAYLRDRVTHTSVKLLALQNSRHIATMGSESDLIAQEIAAFMNNSLKQ